MSRRWNGEFDSKGEEQVSSRQRLESAVGESENPGPRCVRGQTPAPDLAHPRSARRGHDGQGVLPLSYWQLELLSTADKMSRMQSSQLQLSQLQLSEGSPPEPNR